MQSNNLQTENTQTSPSTKPNIIHMRQSAAQLLMQGCFSGRWQSIDSYQLDVANEKKKIFINQKFALIVKQLSF